MSSVEEQELPSTSSATALQKYEATASAIEPDDVEPSSSLQSATFEDSQFRQPTPAVIPEKKKEKRFFHCADCGLEEEYTYYGKTPPFCKAIRFLEDSYVVQDPFTPYSGNTANFLLLGSNCAACSHMTCQECSVFFTKRLCSQCYKLAAPQLPEELLKLKKKQRKTDEK